MRVGVLDVDSVLLAGICRRYGIARLEVFGSVGRNESTEGSDVDLLYELLPGRELGWEIADLEADLARLLGRKVDLVSKRSLHPAIRSEVMAEARLLYAA